MIDFRTVTLELRRDGGRNIERRLGGGFHEAGNFRSHGVLDGSRSVSFPSRVTRAEAAIKAFHFETQNDHHLEKLKIEPTVLVRGNRVAVGVEASFKDDSPDDDFHRRPFIMSVTLLILADRD